MTVAYHTDPTAFARAADAVTARSACSAAFVSLFCAGLARHPPARGVALLLATATIGDAHAIAMQHGANPVVLEHSDPEAVHAIAHALADDGRAVPGVNGTEAACASFASVWRERTGRRAVERVRLRHHVLRSVAPVPSPPGASRVATGDDRAWLVAATDAFGDEAKVPRAPQGTERYVRERLGEGRFRLWEDGGVVAFLGVHGLGEPHARIGPVYTPREHRGRGYATALVADASRELLARGAKHVFLTTDLANPVSNAVYARVGFAPVDDMVGYDFVDA